MRSGASRTLLTVAAAACTMITLAPAARASATVVGYMPLTSTGSLSTVGAGMNVPVFQGDAAANYVLASPVSGTVTSWSFLSAGVAAGKTFVLRVLRPADATGQSWTAVATSAPESVTSATGTDALQGPFPTNLAVKAGDRIGLQPTDDTDTPVELLPGGNGVRYFTAPIADGSTATIASGSGVDNEQIVPVQATVQPIPPPVNTKPPRVVGTAQADQTLTCDPGVWSGGPTFSYEWFLTTLVEVPGGPNRPPRFQHETIQIASGQTLFVADYRPGSSSLSCQVTATNTGGNSTASSPLVTVQAAVPELGLPVHIGRRSIPAQPQITPGVGAGGTNFCRPGIWKHYPTSFAYAWRRGRKVVGHNQTYTLTSRDEGRTLLCIVSASNGAGGRTARSNSYAVPKIAPINTGRPVVFGNALPNPTGSNPPANPGGLNGNIFHLSCGAGGWNRPDLSYSYQWVFDRTGSNSSPAQLTGLSVPGINLTIEINPPKGPLKINGAVPTINGRTAYGLDYLDDSVECMVTATAPNGLTGVALSPPVLLRGPVASL